MACYSSTNLGVGWWTGSAGLNGSSLSAKAQVSSLPIVETEPEKGCLSWAPPLQRGTLGLCHHNSLLSPPLQPLQGMTPQL